jgi:hypothetical protein
MKLRRAPVGHVTKHAGGEGQLYARVPTCSPRRKPPRCLLQSRAASTSPRCLLWGAKIMPVSFWRLQSRASVAQQKRDRSWSVENRPGFHVVVFAMAGFSAAGALRNVGICHRRR